MAAEYLVLPIDDGWAVMPKGALEPHKVFDSRDAAVAEARKLAARVEGKVVVRAPDGHTEETIDEQASAVGGEIHVRAHREGWAILVGDVDRPAHVFDRKERAVGKARGLAIQQEAVLVVHTEDGAVEDRIDYSVVRSA